MRGKSGLVYNMLMKILIAVPLPESVSNSFYSNLIELISYTKKHLKGLEELSYSTKSGVRTDKNRNVLIDEALQYDYDYVLWLDADMVYPVDMIVKYFDHKFKIIGCVYFKRKYPYHPVLYVNGTNPIKPYKMVDPTKLEPNTIYEVDGLGFGGVMVDTEVYRTMQGDKYMNYGVNYHLPYETEGQLTHDLEWCRKAKEYGYKIYVHTGVFAGHITEKIVTVDDFIKAREQDKIENTLDPVTILIPTINPDKAKQTADLIHLRAGYPHKIIVEEDADRIGYVAMINKMAKENPSKYFLYGADDMYPGRNFLSIAMDVKRQTNAKVVALNDGKFYGNIATFAIVDYDYVSNLYNGNILNSMYNFHYADPELTLIAKAQKVYSYAPDALLVEITYDKDGKDSKKNNEEDKQFFKFRKSINFDNIVMDQELLESIK